MKKPRMAFIASAVVVAILFSLLFGCKITAASPGYNIENVTHNVEVLYNGYVLINDTVTVSEQVDSFLLGFPYKYGSHVLQAVAYDVSNESTVFPVNLNVPLENHVGFYGVQVDLSQRTAQVFRVNLVLSSDLLTQSAQNASTFTLDFPAFPSLTGVATVCNSSVVLPSDAQYLGGTVDAFSYSAVNLPAFTYNASSVSFGLTSGEIQIFDIKHLDRGISVNEFGEMGGSDSYSITNNASSSMQSIQIILPPGAVNASAQDQFGRPMSPPVLSSTSPKKCGINFTLPIDPGKPFRFTVTYALPSQDYVDAQNANNYAVNMTLFQDVNYYVEQASVSFSLPEGAHLTSFRDNVVGGTSELGRGVFQDSLTVSLHGMPSLESFSVEFIYEYNPLWLAFRPTLWVWALAIVGCAVFAVWKRPKAPKPIVIPSAAVKLRPEHVKAFIDAYDEKMRIARELESLEARVRKGRIPRRQYKVQKRTLEMRLNAVSRTLAESREKMRSAGSHYLDLMRQLEVAETEIDDVEANVKSIEARHNRGEVTLETYRERLGDYQRRKEKAKTTINGVLLRLREEIG
jgi:hypothetical protein